MLMTDTLNTGEICYFYANIKESFNTQNISRDKKEYFLIIKASILLGSLYNTKLIKN